MSPNLVVDKVVQSQQGMNRSRVRRLIVGVAASSYLYDFYDTSSIIRLQKAELPLSTSEPSNPKLLLEVTTNALAVTFRLDSNDNHAAPSV